MATANREMQLVVFDLGRVLIRICKDWREACGCAGIRISGDSMRPEHAQQLLGIAHQAERGELDLSAFSRNAAPLMGITPAQVCAMSDAFILGTYPGAVELLDELSAIGMQTACLTNTNDHHWGLLSQPDHQAFFPLDRLTQRFASHLIRSRKPDEAIFAQVEKTTGVAPEAILFFDDVGENVEAGRRRGWNGQRVDPGPDDPVPQLRAALRRYRVLP